MIGKKFNHLLVVAEAESKNGRKMWKCKCDCGNFCVVSGQYLRNGRAKSCGCMRKQRAKKMGLNNRRDFGCMNCGSDKHYAKGYCHNCYEKYRRGTL